MTNPTLIDVQIRPLIILHSLYTRGVKEIKLRKQILEVQKIMLYNIIYISKSTHFIELIKLNYPLQSMEVKH